jgi:hypothetical protein
MLTASARASVTDEDQGASRNLLFDHTVIFPSNGWSNLLLQCRNGPDQAVKRRTAISLSLQQAGCRAREILPDLDEAPESGQPGNRSCRTPIRLVPHQL